VSEIARTLGISRPTSASLSAVFSNVQRGSALLMPT